MRLFLIIYILLAFSFISFAASYCSGSYCVSETTACPDTWVLKVTNSGGSPVSGAMVTITGPAPSEYATTDLNGEVRFSSIPEGIYYVSIYKSAPYINMYTNLAYSKSSCLAQINIAGKTECQNTWVITITTNTGTPINGATVTLTGAGPTQSGTTNRDGEARFTDVSGGTYSVSAYSTSPSGSRTATLSYSPCPADVSIESRLQCNNSVKVIVRSNADNRPVANSIVNLYKPTGEFISNGTTNVNGEAYVGPATDKYSGVEYYYVEAMPPNPYASKKEQKYLTYDSECLIDANATLQCDHSMVISVINNKTKQPIAGAAVALRRTDIITGERATTTNAVGYATYLNVDAGTYDIDISHSLTGQKTLSKRLGSPDCSKGRLAMEYACDHLIVQFKDAANVPLLGGVINVYDSAAPYVSVASARTNQFGIALIEIGKGRYLITGYRDPDIFAREAFNATDSTCNLPEVKVRVICPNLLFIEITGLNEKYIQNRTITLFNTAGYSFALQATNGSGSAYAINNVPSGTYSLNMSDVGLLKTINVDASQCTGCSSNTGCAANAACNLAEYECKNITGECGYATNHQWINYECCSDTDCKPDYSCKDNECNENKLELVVPSQTNVGSSPTVTVLENGRPVPDRNIAIEKPNGERITLTTNADGEISFVADFKGDYKVDLLRNNTLLLSRSLRALQLQSEPLDLLKQLIALFQDEKTRNTMIFIIAVAIAALAYLYYKRRRGGEKVRPEQELWGDKK